MLLNNKERMSPANIQVGTSEVKEENSENLMGITIDNGQIWINLFWGKKDLLSSLNQRLFAIR